MLCCIYICIMLRYKCNISICPIEISIYNGAMVAQEILRPLTTITHYYIHITLITLMAFVIILIRHYIIQIVTIMHYAYSVTV